MYIVSKIFLLVFMLLSTPLMAQSDKSAHIDLELKIKGVKNEGGKLLVAVYGDEDSFEKEENFLHEAVITPTEGDLTYSFKGLSKGKYAIAVLHDVNGNEEMDTNFVGMPKEGYGFSGDISKFKKPSFSDVVIMLNKTQEITIEMKYW